MGCLLVTSRYEMDPTWWAHKAEPVTERRSTDEEASPAYCAQREPRNAAAAIQDQFPERFNSKPSVLFVRPAIISQLSDTVDLCGEMAEGELQDQSEAVLERIVRAQYQADHQGDATPENFADVVHDIDSRFKEFLVQFSNRRDPASVTAGCAILDDFHRELDTLRDQLAAI
ncbi:hypothetical protein PHYBOEH_011735 [Phytophthora boehmeriae]|uniref:Uncharacterized protein n=1 Tax=Phytophthora boehmeriae TaxID=109152 RepID=A0A8T1WY09_9STRA|nr:hypothetical protein PHYBOEH_011735 [Phytophthora boehmeriae]